MSNLHFFSIGNFKTLLFGLATTLLLTYAKTGSAQTQWPMPGAKWKYCAIDEAGNTYGFVNYQYVKDTVINTIGHQKISRTYKDLKFPWNQHLVGEIDPNSEEGVRHSIYTRCSNDTVYRYVFGKDYVFFALNPGLDDVWEGFRPQYGSPIDSACISTLPLKVREKSVMTYSGMNLITTKVEDTLYRTTFNAGEQVSNPEFIIIERIGIKNNFPFADEHYLLYCGTETDYGYHLELSSYNDDTFSVELGGCMVDDITTINGELNQIKIYPNPGSDLINFECKGCQQINGYEICDPLGRKMVWGEVPVGGDQINTSSLPQGVFFITFYYGQTNNLKSSMLFVKQ